MRFLYVTVVALSVAMPVTMSAQAINYWTQCATGAFTACASVELWNEADPETDALYLFIRVANVQGTRSFEDLQRYGISAIGINNLVVEDPTPNSLSPNISSRSELQSGFGQFSGNSYYCVLPAQCGPIGDYQQGEYWTSTITLDNPGPGFDGDHVDLYNHLLSDNGNILWGCDAPVLPVGLRGAGTCNGWVTWRAHLGFGAGFRLTKNVNVDLEFWSADLDIPPMTVRCSTGVDCVMVTPEPATVALVATGLAGMAIVRRRRRQQIRSQS